nr:ATP-binding protein [Streptococcus ferus]
MTLGVVLVNRQKKISIKNQAFADLFPDQDPILGLSLFHLQGGHALTVMANKVLETGQRQSQELLLERESEKIFEVSAVPIFEYNRVQQVLLLLYDVTKIRQLEQMRADFVANASHELRTPITSIRGFAETLIDMGEEDPKKQKFLDIIYRESLRLEDIVNDILKLASAEYSDESGQLEAVAVYQLIEEVSQTLAKKMSKKSLTWVLEGDRALTITCDSKQLSQILLNLLTNAINYTEAGGEISVQFFEEEGRLILQVQDTGIGIPKADQEKIFERFYRVNKGRSRQTGGTGLGLAIVKNMLEKMDGQISLTSQLGEGSTFTISLPKKKPKS